MSLIDSFLSDPKHYLTLLRKSPAARMVMASNISPKDAHLVCSDVGIKFYPFSLDRPICFVEQMQELFGVPVSIGRSIVTNNRADMIRLGSFVLLRDEGLLRALRFYGLSTGSGSAKKFAISPQALILAAAAYQTGAAIDVCLKVRSLELQKLRERSQPDPQCPGDAVETIPNWVRASDAPPSPILVAP